MRGCALFLLLALSTGPLVAQELRSPLEEPVQISRGFLPGHKAVDFVAPCGDKIFAVRTGKVVKVVDEHTCRLCYACYEKCIFSYLKGPCFNNEIFVDHEDGTQTRYFHVQRVHVKEGDLVSAGQHIADVGNVGWTCGDSGCHLHFEWVDAQGELQDPDPLWTPPLNVQDRNMGFLGWLGGGIAALALVLSVFGLAKLRKKEVKR